ncbi:MAG: hypothetical protein E6Q24_20105 [Chitinophagaceae bacterium]|nr:MAG: hypothetical protein E6Q24_20105 [Chitinophagaceae bacterium]
MYVAHYLNSDSILLINQTGQIRKLYCPFRVKCITPIDGFSKGMQLWVESVVKEDETRLIYLVLDRFYEHSNFEIIAFF